MSNHAPIGACCAQPHFTLGEHCSDAPTFKGVAVAGSIFAAIAALVAGAFLLFAR